MLNRTIIMGRLTRDPELRRTGSGIAVTGFTVAVDRDYAPKGEEKQTDFIDCTAWRNTGEFVAKYFKKGSMIVVDGRLEQRHWNDKDGNKRTSLEVVADSVYFGEGKKQDNGQQGNNGQNPYGAQSYADPAANAYGDPNVGYGAPQGNNGQNPYGAQGYTAPAAPGYTAPMPAAPAAPSYAAPVPAAPMAPSYAAPAAPGYAAPAPAQPAYNYVPVAPGGDYQPIGGDDMPLPF